MQLHLLRLHLLLPPCPLPLCSPLNSSLGNTLWTVNVNRMLRCQDRAPAEEDAEDLPAAAARAAAAPPAAAPPASTVHPRYALQKSPNARASLNLLKQAPNLSQALALSDCASTCCGAKTGVCNARAVAEGPGGGGCVHLGAQMNHIDSQLSVAIPGHSHLFVPQNGAANVYHSGSLGVPTLRKQARCMHQANLYDPDPLQRGELRVAQCGVQEHPVEVDDEVQHVDGKDEREGADGGMWQAEEGPRRVEQGGALEAAEAQVDGDVAQMGVPREVDVRLMLSGNIEQLVEKHMKRIGKAETKYAKEVPNGGKTSSVQEAEFEDLDNWGHLLGAKPKGYMTLEGARSLGEMRYRDHGLVSEDWA
ncbi:hypothetical protein B0H14DRAFT_2629135 [Mycena olivaceomarginata]|nr:hypothetical protein B0H14DRAFT_2629135 [Mycena olivaceomarginata]